MVTEKDQEDYSLYWEFDQARLVTSKSQSRLVRLVFRGIEGGANTPLSLPGYIYVNM